MLDDGTHCVKNTNEETLELLPRFYVSDGIHEVQCIVQSNSNNSANDISVLSGDGYSTIELFSFITVMKLLAVGVTEARALSKLIVTVYQRVQHIKH